MAASNGKKPIADIAKPGDSPADATARPIITGHEIMKDPMVTEQADSQATAGDAVASKDQKELTPPSVTHKVITPLSAKTDSSEKVAESAEKTPDNPTSDDAVVDAVLEQVDDKKVDNWRDEEEHKRLELVDELVEEKKYFLPINQVRSRRNSKIFLIALAVILPVGIGLLLAVDAGIILPNVKLPFDLIK